jgi:RimJ/RimL family protein N-acetyltransferase
MTAADAQPVLRRVSLPRGQRLVIRRIEERDVDGLAALYAGLDDEARYRRFFSIYRPGRSFFERMVCVRERGGAGLVATLIEDGAGERVVAECSYELLSNGNGELAITVDRAWRGWLGPYLLDALVDLAASRGVLNLEADILVTNRPMLALFRSRGYAAVPNQDWSVLRAEIGAAAQTPTWPASRGRPRLLVEGSGGHWQAAEAATAAGFEVLACPGPVGTRSRCPVLAGEPCPLAAGADVIVVSHPLDADSWSTLRSRHPRLHPGVPICVELTARDDGGAAPGETVLPTPGADVLGVVQKLAPDARQRRIR